ncbi:MAG: hypothetical protein ABR606_02650 [Vicinamibacterales bacterium]
MKGKTGHQRVVVEHVTVHGGGQAIVGEVHTGGRGRWQRSRMNPMCRDAGG